MEQDAERGGSGHESLVPDFPQGLPRPGIQDGRVMPSFPLGGDGVRLMMRRESSELLPFSGLWTSLSYRSMMGVVSHGTNILVSI